MNRDSMMRRVQTLGFVVADVALFLDTHPYDDAALQFYQKYKALSDLAIAEFEALYGPISMDRVNVENGWSWIDHPWPWELEA
jgi:spore coat protein JB